MKFFGILTDNMKKKLLNQLSILTKFFISTCIFYLWLSLNIDKVGEQYFFSNWNEKITINENEIKNINKLDFWWDKLIKEAITEIYKKNIWQIQHNSYYDYKQKFQTLCIDNLLICVKIEFNWEYSYRDKFLYLASIVYVTNFLDKNSKSQKISQKLKKIKLNKNKSQEQRWYTIWNEINIDTKLIKTYKEFLWVITHELWHVFDLAVLQWKSKQKNYNFTEFNKIKFSIDDPSITYYKLSRQNEHKKNKWSVTYDFCSRYGATDPFEDFAECFNLYINHQAIFKTIAQDNQILKHKYFYFDYIFGKKYLRNDLLNYKKFKDNKYKRIRDTTQL